MNGFSKMIVWLIVITFTLSVFTNIFSIFPWTMAIVFNTNMAAREASSYNTLFVESRYALEDKMSRLPTFKDSPNASEWINEASTQQRLAGAGQQGANGALGYNYFASHTRQGSKVIILEAHGYTGSKKLTQQDQLINPNGVNSASGSQYTHGKYLEDLDVVTVAAFPLRLGLGKVTFLSKDIVWAYHAPAVGLHMYK